MMTRLKTRRIIRQFFLTPDSNVWNPYDESYKRNEDSNLDSRGRMAIPSTPIQLCIIRDSEVSSVKQVTDRNDVATITTDNFSRPTVTWRDEMLLKRRRAKLKNKYKRTKSNASFALAVAEAQLPDLIPDEDTFEAPSPVDWSMDELPDIPQPMDWTNSEPESVLQLPIVISAIDCVIDTSVVAVERKDCKASDELKIDCELFKMDPIRSEVASMSCTYDPVLFCDLLDDQVVFFQILCCCWKHDS